MQGRQSLLTFLTMVTRWSSSSFNFYALIGQSLTVEFMRKMYAASETCFPIAEADRVLCRQLVMFLTVFFHCELDVQNEHSYCQLLSVIHGWFVYWIYGEKCAVCQNHRKSNFVRHCFRFSPCLMRRRV